VARVHGWNGRDYWRYSRTHLEPRRLGRRAEVKLLLDTHIWLWNFTDPDRLARGVDRAINDSRNELWVSPVSTWEISLLYDSGRLKLTGGPNAWVQEAMTRAPLREAPLTHEIALATRSVRLAHKDPADRFLVAIALVHGLTLVTADRQLSRLEQVKVLVNQ
jgi:PIN domain nuclease of toxin-antitoxin system